MLQIFADVSAIRDGILAIGGSDYNHIKNVLRMRPGEKLAVRRDSSELFGDGCGMGGQEEYLFEIDSFTDEEVFCRLLTVERTESELPVRVMLFQGLPKSDKMDLIVQKTVEMGAADIIPVEMHRSIVKLTGDKRRKRVGRWQSIAEAAAKQSKRAVIPQVHDIMTMEEAVSLAAAEADRVLLPYEGMAGGAENGTRTLLESLVPGQTVAVFVGPEGGFEDSEVSMALRRGAETISLGRRILRTETAALAFLSFLVYRFELD